MNILYLNDAEECFQCGKPTKRVNADLELPSCCGTCDNKLSEEVLNEAN